MAESAPALQGVDAHAERRLHPLSWLFVLLQQLRQFILPLLALLIFGRGDRNELWPLVAVGVLAALAVWRYYTYRFRIDSDSLQIRSGVLQRSLRQIPFARIQNVALHQSLLHRIFGVAEVRLESAGGVKPEAEMRVLKLEDALALEAIVRRSRSGAARTAAAVAATPGAPGTVDTAQHDAGEELLRLSFGDVIRVGLISNRGMVVVGGAFAAVYQMNGKLVSNVIEDWGRVLFGVVDEYSRGHEAMALISMALFLFVLLRLFSVLLAILQYSGFRLEEHGRRLTLERGLLTRLRTSTPRRRIQAWTLREGVLHRLLGRRTLEVSTAVLDNGSDQQPRSLRDIAPVATPERCDALIRHLAPRVQWPVAEWRPVHRGTGWRLFVPHLFWATLAGGGVWWHFGMRLGAPVAGLWLAWAAYIAWQHARHSGHAMDDVLIATRSGWWSRTWRFAEIGKLQAVRLSRTPADRWFGTATLLLDTAGGHAMGDPLRIRFVPVDEARVLHETLARRIARSALRW